MHYGIAPGLVGDFPTHSTIQVPSMANQLFKQLLHVSSFSPEEADAAALLLLERNPRRLPSA